MIESNIPKCDSDLVMEFLNDIVDKASALIEGKFMDSFEVEFEVDGKLFKICMEKPKTQNK